MTSRKLMLYAAGGLGMNLLNLIVGSYICSALLVGGFSEAALPFHTFAQMDLVIASVWGSVILLAKIVDGIVDIPIGLLIDKLKAKKCNMRVMLGISAVLTLIFFVLLLVIPSYIVILNTAYYGIMLCFFYVSYTATMECYYSTFTDVAAYSKQIQKLSNYKSIFDVVYFIIGYVIIAALLSTFNIRSIALCVLPFSLTMSIPIIMHKDVDLDNETFEDTSFTTSLKIISRDKTFIYWLCVFTFINLGLQLFLGGINEYFSSTNLNMVITMASVFIPLPFSFWLSSKHYANKGFISTLLYSLLYVILGMLILFIAAASPECGIYLSIGAGVTMSFGIGTLFSIGYSIPGKLAAKTNQMYKCDITATYFAIQGLVGAISAGIGSGIILVFLKQNNLVYIIPVIIIALSLLSICMLQIGKYIRSVNYLGGIDD